MTTWVAVDEAALELGISADELRRLVLERHLSRRDGPQGVYAIQRKDLADLFLGMQRRKRMNPTRT